MFKLAPNGDVLLNVVEYSPPSAAFIIEALEKSTFCDYKIARSAIHDYFKNEHPEATLIVATKHDAILDIVITDDKMFAVGELTLAQGGKEVSLNEAKKKLVEAGVVRGYKQIFLERLLAKQLELQPGEIAKGILAKGRQAVDGNASQFIPAVKTLEDRLKKPKLKEDGSVDMRDFGKLANVQPGITLIRQQPSTAGKEGYKITGEVLPAKAGENKPLIAGDGTEISKNNPLELVSTIAGVPVEIKNGMRVDNIFTIPEVNIKSGHIDFEGSVIVTRNVEPGMKINAKGDITVLGSVESSELIAGGSITVKQGIIGHQKDEDKSLSCRLTCNGDINVAHSQYCYLEAENIVIQRQSSHCFIKAVNLLQVGSTDSPKGMLFGGEILDATTLIAGEIGNDSGVKMIVNLAVSGAEITENTDKCFKTLAKTHEQLDALQTALAKAELVKDTQKKQLLISKIGATQLHYCEQAEQLEKRLSNLEHNLHDLLTNTNLTVNTTLHSGVEIHIFEKVLKTTRSYPPCRALLKNNKIEIEFKMS